MMTQTFSTQTFTSAEDLAAYLPGCDYRLRDFVASALNPATPMSLHLEICPECGFLLIACTDCDVCATMRVVTGFPMPCLRPAGNSLELQMALAEARGRRARILYDQWMSGHLGADALFWASLPEEDEPVCSEPTEIDLLDWEMDRSCGTPHFAAAPGETHRLVRAA